MMVQVVRVRGAGPLRGGWLVFLGVRATDGTCVILSRVIGVVSALLAVRAEAPCRLTLFLCAQSLVGCTWRVDTPVPSVLTR